MSHIGNLFLETAFAAPVPPAAGLLKPGLPAGDFWASLGLSLLVLLGLVQGWLYLRRLTRRKPEP